MNGKKNGKGVEYDRLSDIKYVGEFLNGKKNGKIKEYAAERYFYNIYDSEKPNLIFEGEYLNNFRKKGKEYYKNGKLLFEGEYLFTKKWNGKIYDYNGNVLFELNKGNGIIENEEYDEKIRIFIGENLDKKIRSENVKVKEYDYNGRILFEGEYLNGRKWNGKGKVYNDDDIRRIYRGKNKWEKKRI